MTINTPYKDVSLLEHSGTACTRFIAYGASAEFASLFSTLKCVAESTALKQYVASAN